MTDETKEPVIGGTLLSPVKRRAKTSARTLVFTCAQNNTHLHDKFWDSLMHFVSDRDAELHVSRITYNKATIAAGKAKPGTEDPSDNDDMWYDPRIQPYISDEAVQITKDLVWCGELNILPTRVNPLSTFKTYTRRASGIVPHVKMAMESIPVMPKQKPRFMYTTGTITLRNYIQKAAGQVAEFHHVFGALVVEIEGENWWARQINADADGVFYDLNDRFDPDGKTPDLGAVTSIVHGDIHIGKADHKILNAVFNSGGVVDRLMPRYQFFHDLLDFTPRNHHNIKDPHFLWSKAAQMPVAAEFDLAADLLRRAWRPWTKLRVVVSNHDQAIHHWLKNTAGFLDPINRHFWLKMNMYVSTMRTRDKAVRPFEWALKDAAVGIDLDYLVINEEESYVIDGIEYGLHGHLGPNGARGSPRNLRLIGKANTAHTHSAGIVEGVATTGVYGLLDMGYNKGPSSWSHSFVVTYAHGKRAVYTFSAGKPWRGFNA